MDFKQALEGLAKVLKQVSSQTPEPFYWLINGDEPNSLCKLLDLTASCRTALFTLVGREEQRIGIPHFG